MVELVDAPGSNPDGETHAGSTPVSGTNLTHGNTSRVIVQMEGWQSPANCTGLLNQRPRKGAHRFKSCTFRQIWKALRNGVQPALNTGAWGDSRGFDSPAFLHFGEMAESGLWRSLGKRVSRKGSQVQILFSPPVWRVPLNGQQHASKAWVG